MSSTGTVVDRGLEGVIVGSTELSNVEGIEGRLTYRGFDIHDLAPHATFEEIVYLLLFGQLPNRHQLADLVVRMGANRLLPQALIDWMHLVQKDAWPMDVLRTAISALALYAPYRPGDGWHSSDARTAIQLISKAPVIVAAWDRIRRDLPPIEPRPDLTTAGNFLYMRTGELPIMEAQRALDTYLVLLADHSYNASTFSARVTASTRADMYAAATAALATLEGDLHGGAPGKVMVMLQEIGKPERAEAYVRELLARGEKVMGMGHREYKIRDPRAQHLEEMAKALGEASDPRWYEIARARRCRLPRAQRSEAGPSHLRQRRVLLCAHALQSRDSRRRVYLHVRVRSHGRLDRAHHRATRRQPPHSSAGNLRRTERFTVRADRRARSQRHQRPREDAGDELTSGRLRRRCRRWGRDVNRARRRARNGPRAR